MFVQRTQYAIGQGGFHMCEIRVGRRHFRYIYDCGSRSPSALDPLIEARATANKEFDWLVISSFDADHLNGVTRLVDKGYSFRAVVLPHLLNRELLEQILLYYLAAGMEADIGTTVEVLRRMVAGDFGRVIPGADDRVPDNLNGDGLVDTRGLARDSVGRVSGKAYWIADADWMFKFYSVEVSGKEAIELIFDLASLAPLRALIRKIAASLEKQVQPAQLGILLKELDKELDREHPGAPSPTKSGSSAKAAKAPLLNDAALIGKTIKEIIGCGCAAVKARGGLIHDYNSASLCLYSGPIPEMHPHWKENLACLSVCINPDRDLTQYRAKRMVGWIGVGDITFKNRASVDSFIRHYLAELPLAGTRMMPHHGAQSNYDDDLVQCRAFFNAVPQQTLWVAAAKPVGGGYRHPDGVVVAECTYRGKFHLVSADPATTLREMIE